MGGAGCSAAGRAQRGEARGGGSEVGTRGSEWGRPVPAPAGASRREEAHACRAWALTRQGKFGAACKRKDRKSGQRRGQAWAERSGEEELEQSCVCPKDTLETLARPSQMPTPLSRFSPAPVPSQTLFPPQASHPSPSGTPVHPAPPGCLLVDAALAQTRGLLLSWRGGQGQPHAGCTVVDTAGTGSGRRGDRD